MKGDYLHFVSLSVFLQIKSKNYDCRYTENT